MATQSESPPPYGSAHDLPSIVEMHQQLTFLKVVTRFIGRDQRQGAIDLQQKIRALSDLVDQFYATLGERHWIFTDYMPTTDVEVLLNEASTPEEAEAGLIRVIDERLRGPHWPMGLLGHEAMRARQRSLERARRHYFDEQWDSCALVLVPVMDGFINDVEPAARRGMHTREPDEMVAWDSLVGHHKGLLSVMPEFLKTFKKRRDDEVFELHRHGIVHGTITNYNNKVVATKAWNMLGAVADWAAAKEKEAKPPEPKPTVRDVLAQLHRHAEYTRYRDKFEAWNVTADDDGFSDIDVVKRAEHFLESWRSGRWALVAESLPSAAFGKDAPVGARAGTTRNMYEHHPLSEFELVSASFPRANVAVIKGTATIGDTSGPIEIRWIRVGADGKLVHPGDDDARWELAVYPPNTFMKQSS